MTLVQSAPPDPQSHHPIRHRSSLGTKFLARHINNLTLSKSDLEHDDTSDDTWGPLGLNLLHEPSDPLIDFIFVHGLGGGSRKTWSKTSSIGHYWPQVWLPKESRFKNVRTHAFGYNSNWRQRGASSLTVHDFGQALLAAIHNSPTLNQSEKDTPIVLVGHSMGGVVIKKMLLLAKQDPSYVRIACRIHSMFFLATPHRGSNLAELLSSVIKLAVGHGSKAYVDGLVPNSEASQAINDQFRHNYQGIHLKSFFETLPTALGLIVDKNSAILGLPGEEVQLLNADHSNVCKFEKPSDNNYCTIRNAFITTITSIEKTYLTPKTQQRDDQMKTLSDYLGLVDRPNTDLTAINHHQTEGSCSWLTDSPLFLKWQQGLDDSPKCYWLSGEPASGKSTLAGHVVRYLDECNCDVSYFFFNDSNSRKSKVAKLLCSLAWQMALSNITVREKLLAMCEEGITISHTDEVSIWRNLFTTLILRTELRQPQYWVIDALDECANYAALFPFLNKIEEQFPLRIFLTSRPSLTVERLFQRENVAKIASSITLEASLGDIKLFLEEHASYLLAESEEERQQLVQLVLDKSNGNFLWTALVVKELEDAISKEQVREILTSVPKEIGNLYSQILRNVMATPKYGVISKAILRWTLCASRPLLVEELKEALKLDVGETLSQLDKTIGSICGNLVSVDTESRVKIAHQTVREFLFQEEATHEFAMDRAEEHARIADICLEYLCGDELRPPRVRRGTHARASKNQRSVFAAYAVVHFSEHIARATSSDTSRLTSLNNFFMSNSLAWIEAIATTRDLSPIIKTAKNIKAYLERRGKYKAPIGIEFSNVSEWTDDLIHLVAQFGMALLASPHAIYHLIQPICPSQSIIFRTFKSHSRGLQVIHLSQKTWDDRLCCIVKPDTQILSVSSRDNRFALGTSNGRVYIYQESTFQETLQLIHGEPVRRLAFTARSTCLSAAGRRKISFWNCFTGKMLWSIATKDEILALAFNEDDTQLYAATRANYVMLLDIQKGERVSAFRIFDWDEDEKGEHSFRRPPMHIDISVGLGLLGVTYRLRPVTFWDLETNEFAGQFHRSRAVYPEPFISAFIFNPNPEITLAAATYQDGKTITFDPEDLKAQSGADTDATILAASPDGTVLATGSGDGIITLYDFETMKMLRQIHLIQQDIRAITFNSTGTRFFDIRGDYCNIWEPSVLIQGITSEDSSSTGCSDKELPAPGISSASTYDVDLVIVAVTAHSGSDYVFCGRENGTVAAYSTKSGLVAQELFKHDDNVAVDFLAWNQHENVLASANRSGRVVIRKLVNLGSDLFEINEPILDEMSPSVIHQLLLSPNGKRLLVSTEDLATLWDLTNGTIVETHPAELPLQLTQKWVSHPEIERLFLFIGGNIQVFDWNTLEELSVKPSGINVGSAFWDISNIILHSGGRNVLAVLTSPTGSDLPPSIGLLPSTVLLPDHNRTPTLMCQRSLAKDLKAIVGAYKSWLIFLNHNGWICSINMDTALNNKFYIRHCFVPLQWQIGIGTASMAITPKGSVVIGVNDEIVIFHNVLEFEEKVPLSEWVSIK